MEYVRNCKICGKEFKTTANNKKTCSETCRRENAKRLAYAWYHSEANHEQQLQYRRDQYRINKPKHEYKSTAICRICGGKIDNEMLTDSRRRKQIHDECVFEDCKYTLESGKTLSNLQFTRLARRGYTVAEFKEEYMNEAERNS